MSSTVHLSDVQLLNLSILMTIQASITQDPVAACFRFNLGAHQAARIQRLRQEELQTIVANSRHEALISLREDFWRFLNTPPGLQGPLSMARLAETQSTAVDVGSVPRRSSA